MAGRSIVPPENPPSSYSVGNTVQPSCFCDRTPAVVIPRSWKQEPYNQRLRSSRRWRGQVGIVAEIERCGSVFDLVDDELLDGVEADGAEPDRVERRRGDERRRKDLHQPQRLDELALEPFTVPDPRRCGILTRLGCF